MPLLEVGVTDKAAPLKLGGLTHGHISRTVLSNTEHTCHEVLKQAHAVSGTVTII